jgi:hypothetical protein
LAIFLAEIVFFLVSRGDCVLLQPFMQQRATDAMPAPGTFEILKEDRHTGARLGRLWTAHGAVETPVFMPVGTQATVKALEPRDLEELGASIILGNTYHLLSL